MNTAQLTQNITLFGVDGYKFKTLYVVQALAETLDVPATSIYAQVLSKRLSSRSPVRVLVQQFHAVGRKSQIDLTYTAVTSLDAASNVSSAMESLTDVNMFIFIANLQV